MNLKTSLAQSLENGKLRRIIEKEGLGLEDQVLLSVEFAGKQVLSNYEIPTTSLQASVAPIENNFEQEIKKFLNDAQTSHGLLTTLYPEIENISDDSAHIRCSFTFEIASKNKKLSFEAGVGGQCGPRLC